MTSKKVSTYTDPESNQYKRYEVTFNAICRAGSVLELQLECWLLLQGDQWTDVGAQYLWINDYESSSTIPLVEYDFEKEHLQNMCIEGLSEGRKDYELYSFQHQLGTKCGQYCKFDGLFRLIREYITTPDHVVINKIPGKIILAFSTSNSQCSIFAGIDKWTPELNLGQLAHSMQMLYRKYKGISSLYKVINFIYMRQLMYSFVDN